MLTLARGEHVITGFCDVDIQRLLPHLTELRGMLSQ
jgi:hypothetical protein